MASTLVIGVGTTGKDVIEQAQQYYYEFTKHDAPDNAAFMFLETAKQQPKLTPNGTTRIQVCDIWTDNIEATLKEWKQGKKYKWLPSEADVLNQHDGAANQPAIGRVALWANEEKVQQKVNALYQSINGDGETNIYIVGSLTGGTGTGVFMDLAYMVRKYTGNNNIYGMFLLPNRGNVGRDGTDLLYENAYTSLRTLDYYSVTKNKEGDEETSSNYECVLPNGTDISSKSVPFKNAQFFTQDFKDATAPLRTLEQLIQSVGFNLVLRLLDVDNQGAKAQDTMQSKRVDYFSFVKRGLYTTIGMSVYQYPEALLEEYLTTKYLESNLLNRWADTTNYVDQFGTTIAISTIDTKIKIEARHFVHEEIEKAVIKSKGAPMLGKATFYDALQNEIDVIISGNYHAPSEQNYLYSLFNADSQAPKFYAAISGQATLLRDALIDSIAMKIKEESNKYQNLTIVRKWLLYVVDELNNINKEWQKRFKLDGSHHQWNVVWKQLFSQRLEHGKFFYSLLGVKREWYTEALDGVATVCYFNAFVPMINAIVNSINNNNGMHILATANGTQIPSIRTLNNISQKVAHLLNPQDDNSLVARKEALRGMMNNNSNSQITFLFNGANCDSDVQVAEGKYNNQTQRLEFPVISQQNLWDFLNDNDEIRLKAVMISEGLRFIQQLHLFEDTDVVKIMCNLPKEHRAYNRIHTLLTNTEENIRNTVPAMVHLVDDEQFKAQDSLKLIIMSALAEDNSKGIVHQMQQYHPSEALRNYIQLQSLMNTVVVYQEYGYLGSVNGKAKAFNPLIHICYQKQVLEKMKERIKSGDFDTSMRLAYIDQETLLDTNNVNVK